MEAFPGRFFTEILTELQRLPVGLLDEVLEAKAYRQVKAMVDDADTPAARKRLPKIPMVGLVNEIEFALVNEARERKG
jgi:hypothetical protein